MGAYLSEPIRQKDSCDESADNLTYGASCMQGWRVSQEVAIFHPLKFLVFKATQLSEQEATYNVNLLTTLKT